MGRDHSAIAIGRQQGGLLDDIYRRHWLELCHYLKKTFGAGPPEPEDVAQAAFARFASLDRPTEIQNPRAFLYATARNIVIDHKRAQGRHSAYARDVQREAATHSLDEISPERVLLEKQRLAIVRRTVLAMPARQRRVVVLHRLHNLTYSRIAADMGLSETTIRRLVADAVAQIDEALRRAAAVAGEDTGS